MKDHGNYFEGEPPKNNQPNFPEKTLSECSTFTLEEVKNIIENFDVSNFPDKDYGESSIWDKKDYFTDKGHHYCCQGLIETFESIAKRENR